MHSACKTNHGTLSTHDPCCCACPVPQVLPARTHPRMTTSGTGGYILSGTKIMAGADAKPLASFLLEPADSQQQAQRQQQQVCAWLHRQGVRLLHRNVLSQG